jgi:hypothetical protein
MRSHSTSFFVFLLSEIPFRSDNLDSPGIKTKQAQLLTSQDVLLQKYMSNIKLAALIDVSVNVTLTNITLPKIPLLTSIIPTKP